MIHGNLKSSNVIILKEGVCSAKLTDFIIYPLNLENIKKYL